MPVIAGNPFLVQDIRHGYRANAACPESIVPECVSVGRFWATAVQRRTPSGLCNSLGQATHTSFAPFSKCQTALAVRRYNAQLRLVAQ